MTCLQKEIVEPLIFRQLFHHDTSTFSYLLACSKTKKAIIIDPVLDCVDRDVKLMTELELDLIYGINTHCHTDHTFGTGKLKQIYKGCKSVLGEKTNGKANVYAKDGQLLQFGELEIEMRSTPGHTDGCLTPILHKFGMAFTGDAVFIRGCGRTDLQGDPAVLYDTVHSKIFTLPPHFKLYPAHDYKGFHVTTVAEELRYNPRFTLSKEAFIEVMNNLNLDKPTRMDVSFPANLKCGIPD